MKIVNFSKERSKSKNRDTSKEPLPNISKVNRPTTGPSRPATGQSRPSTGQQPQSRPQTGASTGPRDMSKERALFERKKKRDQALEVARLE